VKKEHIVIIVLLLLIVVMGVIWIITSQPRQKDWVKVGSWESREETETDYNMTTEQFVITGEEWDIRWDCGGNVENSHIEIIVYDAYTDSIVKEITSTLVRDFGVSYLNLKGRFYLRIFIRGTLHNWYVVVREYM